MATLNDILKIIGNEIVIVSVKMYKAIDKIVIHVKGKMGDLPETERKCAELADKLNVGSVRLFFEEQKIEDCIDIVEKNWQYIKNYIYRKHPSYREFMDNLKMERSKEVISFHITNKVYFEFIESKHILKIISSVTNEYYGFDLHYNLIFDEETKEESDGNINTHRTNALNREKKLIDNVLNSKDKEINAENIEILGKAFKNNPVNIIDLREDSGTIAIRGKIFKFDERILNDNRIIFKYWISDNTNSIVCKHFFRDAVDFKKLKTKLDIDMSIKVKGPVSMDKYERELVIEPKNIMQIEEEKRLDTAVDRRVELHLHTTMSDMDAVSSVKKIIKRAISWGHKAVAITDHGVVQAFPEAFETKKKAKSDIKIIYGVEGYLFDDGVPIVYDAKDYDLDKTIVVFDLETTGFDAKKDRITEIGAVKIENGKIIDKFSMLINPEIDIPYRITQITGIDNAMVAGAPIAAEAIPQFLNYIGELPLVAHNAMFDYSFIKENCERLNIDFSATVLDTVQLSKTLLPELDKHNLAAMVEYFDISLENHHRASDDASATAILFTKLTDMLKEKGIVNINMVNSISMKGDYKDGKTNHIIILVKNKTGLKNLYKLISTSHIDTFYRRPRMLKSVIKKYREGLIIGSACEAGEIFSAFLKKEKYSEIYRKSNFYDYFEIQPDGNNEFLLRDATLNSLDELHKINKDIIALGVKMKKPVVATGDVHFLDPEDEVYRRIIMAGKGFKDADMQAPLYFKTTDEMLNEFSYLGEALAREVVVTNTNIIADMIEDIKPIPDETATPKIEGAEEQIEEMTMNKAYKIYGKVLPDIVQARLDKELKSIIGNGYAVLYLIAQKLVKKSNDGGYLVGSRGSVGSSFVATMCDITEVNPLSAHYVCSNCCYSEFIMDGSVSSGADLPDKKCPHCDTIMIKDGHDIPFEAFLGFDGDKEPDIDLNFYGEGPQEEAHKYTEELFGKEYVFRAGTIGTIAEKTAYGFVKNYYDGKDTLISEAEINRLVVGCTGIKRTTGQHPGGVMVVPNYTDIYEYTPIQRPSNDVNSNTLTTHFDYHSISGRLLKLDILGHDVPGIIHMLEELTGHSCFDIPLDDPGTMNLFISSKNLGVDLTPVDCTTGSLSIPEFGTGFVRQMLIETQPTTLSELIRISGLSHGTDVWANNAQEIIKAGKATLKDVICTRDDIMLFLIKQGVDPKMAFNIMESVRKGKGLTIEQETEMLKHDLPEWYIGSCKKIQYMFPRAHAAAYVMMAFRIAYYKLNYPEAFYATQFYIKLEDFDSLLIAQGKEKVLEEWTKLNKLGNDIKAKEKSRMTVLELAYEMYERGINMCNVDLYKSDAKKFLIAKEGIIPPLASMAGLGVEAAQSVVIAREEKEFQTVEDLIKRTKMSKTVVEILRAHGALEGIPDTSQISLF